jgi:murein DD-endopeptidase MepM/ murein hydrolase activator NlpD
VGEAAPGRRGRGLGPLVAVLAVVVGYSQWTALPWLPAWVVPVLAAAAALLVVRGFVLLVRRSMAARRRGGRLPAVALAVNTAALVVFAILPASRLGAVVAPATPGVPPRLLSGFDTWLGAEGYPRINGRHLGVDLAARPGSPVIAPADGRVVLARDNRNSCGLIVVIEHGDQGDRTIYCHLSAIGVARDQAVRRGDAIGAVGTTGMRPWPGYEHLHWELQRGRGGPYEDPLPRAIGCFERTRSYPADPLAFTYPLPC